MTTKLNRIRDGLKPATNSNDLRPRLPILPDDVVWLVKMIDEAKEIIRSGDWLRKYEAE